MEKPPVHGAHPGVRTLNRNIKKFKNALREQGIPVSQGQVEKAFASLAGEDSLNRLFGRIVQQDSTWPLLPELLQEGRRRPIRLRNNDPCVAASVIEAYLLPSIVGVLMDELSVEEGLGALPDLIAGDLQPKPLYLTVFFNLVPPGYTASDRSWTWQNYPFSNLISSLGGAVLRPHVEADETGISYAPPGELLWALSVDSELSPNDTDTLIESFAQEHLGCLKKMLDQSPTHLRLLGPEAFSLSCWTFGKYPSHESRLYLPDIEAPWGIVCSDHSLPYGQLVTVSREPDKWICEATTAIGKEAPEKWLVTSGPGIEEDDDIFFDYEGGYNED